MALSAAERQRRRYAKNPERVRTLARAFYRRHYERLRLKRQCPAFRAKRAEYMRRRRQEEAEG